MGDWRRTLRALHRDVGYFLAPLVVVFALSGVAVNHIEDWNPSYAKTTTAVALGALPVATPDETEREIVRRVPLDPAEVRGRRRESASKFVVFLDEGSEVSVDPATGAGTHLRIARRPFLFDANVLHLNHMKGAWTIVSDVVALLLACLAISGLLLLRGPTGLAGRGKWFLAGGLAVPVGFVIAYHLR